MTQQSTDAGSDAPADELSEDEVRWRLVESRVAATRPDLDGRLGGKVDTFWELEDRQRPASELLLYEVVLSEFLRLTSRDTRQKLIYRKKQTINAKAADWAELAYVQRQRWTPTYGK